MIMAKGCPYEAATMMLKGGTGLLYLPAGVYDTVKADEAIQSITPIFVGIASKEGSGIREEEGAKSFSILSGIDTESFMTMKPWMKFKSGPGFDHGRWFSQASTNEVVLGFVTLTSTGPWGPAGVVAVIVVALTTVTPVAGFPAKRTVAPASKLEP